MKKIKLNSIYQLLIIMIIVSLFLTIASIIIIYKITYNEKRIFLKELCENQKEIIQSMFKETKDANAILSVLNNQSKITNGMGTTGEYTIGYSKNDSIVFLIRMRQSKQTNHPHISLKSDSAIPMQYALSENTGFIKGKDYNGKMVFSYCTYIPEFKWGIVAKMDMSEVRLPFYRAGIYAIISSIILIILSIIFFKRVSLPITKKIDESEENYRRLFEYSAIPIWKEDYSEIKKYFDKLKYSGVTDFRAYFEAHKSEINHLASLIKVVEINQKSVELFNAESKEDVIKNMLFYFNGASLDIFKEELIVLAEGGKRFECEMPIRTLTGEIKILNLHLSVVKGFENTLSNVLVSFIDITERKNNEEILRRSRKEWMETFDMIPDMITILDNRHRIVRANKALTDKLGISPQDTIGLHCYQCIHGKQESPVFCPHTLMLKDGKEHIADFHEEKLGMDLLVSVTPIYDNKGNLTGSVHIARDITERKQIEDTLLFLLQCGNIGTSNNFFELLARFLSERLAMDFVCIDKLQGDLLSAKTLAVYFDGKFDDNIEYTLKDTPCGDVVGKTICTFPNNVRNLFPNDIVLQEMYAESYIGTTLWDSAGKPIGLIAVIGRKPITNLSLAETIMKLVAIRAAGELERMLAEEMLANSEIRYRRLFETAKDGILILDAVSGTIVDVNPYLIDKLGYPYDAFLGKTIWDIGFFKDIVASKDNFIKLQQNDYIRYENLPLETSDGHQINVEFVSNVYFVNNQKVIQCNIRDITERKKFENELKEKNVELVESNATKDKFFKIIAHDMKNPYISLLGASELLYENAHKYDTNKIAKLTKVLNDSAKSGYDMLLNLLEWARSQAGSMIFQPEIINLKELIDKHLSNLVEYASNKKINLNFDISSNIQVYADKNMLNTILRNLINNALKFTSKGGIVTVSTKYINGSVIIFIKDTGVGIDNKDFDKLFRTDIKYSQQGTELEGGTGLGLLLCKEFVEKHGGKIWVESEVKKGSTFYFNLSDAENN
ncbi:MAG: PAS domain S-box protein [Bacteroidales bacterium]|jgi:PAS domain S-box-containing protein